MDGPTGFGSPPSPERNRWRPDLPGRRDVVAALIVAVALVIAGVLLGLLWGATAPKIDVAAGLNGSEAAFDSQGGVDVMFAFLSVLVGLAIGFLVGWRARNGAWPMAVALAVGGVGGSLIAGVVGHALRSHDVLKQLPPNVTQTGRDLFDFTLRAQGFYLVLPAAALLAYGLVVLFATKAEPPRLPDAPDPDVYWSTPR
jgi:hypothetical protein